MNLGLPSQLNRSIDTLRSVLGLWLATGLVLAPAAMAQDLDTEKVGPLDLSTISRYFAEFDSLCTRDAGSLWGISYAGPILIVDPVTRRAAGNRADSSGVLVGDGEVFAGQLPPGVPIANTAVDWLGTRWTMLLAGSLSGSLRPRLQLMGHEAFHRIQPQLGLEPQGELSEHLNSRDGRFWIQMEWNALQRALLAGGQSRRSAVRDARVFRLVRRAAFPQAAPREVPLEVHEGLAEYAGARLVDYSDSALVEVVAARRARETGLVRSFAYVSGPLYGFLLDGASSDWRRRLNPKTDLAELLASEMRLEPPSERHAVLRGARRRAAVYGGDTLWAGETIRERHRIEQETQWRRSLVEGSVLIVDLSSVQSGSFDPRFVFPMGKGRTVYTTRTLQGQWGELVVEKGAVLEDSGQARVSLRGASADRMKGEGWALTLTPGWQIVPSRRSGDFEIVKQ